MVQRDKTKWHQIHLPCLSSHAPLTLGITLLGSAGASSNINVFSGDAKPTVTPTQQWVLLYIPSLEEWKQHRISRQYSTLQFFPFFENSSSFEEKQCSVIYYIKLLYEIISEVKCLFFIGSFISKLLSER